MPDQPWKRYLLNSLLSVNWPDVPLPVARVGLTPGITVSIIPHLREFDFAAHIYRRLNYEPEVTSWLSGRQYDVIVEIGANVGIHTLLFSRIFPNAKLYCFEPSRAAYRRLLDNLALNSCPHVYPFNCAVSAQTEFMDFYEPEGHLTNGSLDRSFAQVFASSIKATKVVSLNGAKISELIPVGQSVLLKIDVEGCEPVVLNSLERFIMAEKPDILIEVLSPTVDALNRIDVLRAYRFYELDPDGPRERDSFVAGASRDYALVATNRESAVPLDVYGVGVTT